MKNTLGRIGCAALALCLMATMGGAAMADVVLSDLDYSNGAYWVAHAERADKPYDVFTVCPTVFYGEEAEDIPHVRIDNPVFRESAAGWLKAVEPVISGGNVYSPLYRQMNAIMLGQHSPEEINALSLGLPRDDVFAAFDYFLKHINKGERPFVLFGHSQGSLMVASIATQLLGDPAYAAYNDMHAATYACGIAVTQSQVDLNPQLHFATGRLDTQAILAWNTTAPSEIASGEYKNFVTWNKDALVINPVNWTRNELLAHSWDNQPVTIAGDEGESLTVRPNALVDMEARLLVVTNVDEAISPKRFPILSRFHGFDVTFFGASIRANIEDRAGMLLK